MTANELADRFFDIGAELETVENQIMTLALIAAPRETAFPDSVPSDDIFRTGWLAIQHHVERLGEELADGPELERLDDLSSEIASVSDALYFWQALSEPSASVKPAGGNWDDALWTVERHLERIAEDVSRLSFKKEERTNVENKGQR